MRKKALSTAISLALSVGTISTHAAAQTPDDGVPDREQQVSDRIKVQAFPIDRTVIDSAEPVDILVGEELDDSRGLTLGETLDSQPGIHSTYYGPGAGRPIIRGLSGPRVQVLEDGLASGDASAPSDDHAVAIDPMLIDRIEILRGPATLLYGSAATGGAVNLIDNRIPTSVPDRALIGLYEARGDTAADERSGVLRLDGGGGNFAWHFDGSYRDAGDYAIPGAARRELAEEHHDDHEHEESHDHHHDHSDSHDHDHAEGILENSFVESQSATVGASWIGNRGYLGASFRTFETEYGIPAPHSHAGHDHDDEQHEDHEDHHAHDDHDHDNGHSEEDSFAFIDMEQKSWDLKAGLEDPVPGFTRATLKLGYRDYQHFEIEMEGDEHGHEHEEDHDDDHSDDEHGHMHAPTLFDVETFLSRLELRTAPVADWNGAIGLQIESQDFKTDGEEIFIAPNQTDTMAVFALQERSIGDFTLSVGARLESTDVSVDPSDHDHEHHDDHHEDHHDDHGHHDDHHHDEHSDVDERSFTTWSASFGAVWEINDLWRTSLNISRAQRAPSATELFADGPHLATFSFEKGTPSLRKETTTAWDLGLRRNSDNLDLELNLFQKDVNNLVYLEDTGEMRDGLTLREFKQDNGQFYGLEALATWKLHETGFGDFDLRTGYDLVRGELDDGSNLPRISPERLTVGVDWGTGPWRGGVEWQRVFRQDRSAEFEGETPGYNLTHATLAYQFTLGRNWAEIFFQGRNLGDNEARVHTSALREYAPLPGRNFRFGIRGSF